MKRLLFFLVFASFFVLKATAQDWLQYHVNYDGHEWAFPINANDIYYQDFNADQSVLQIHRTGDESLVVPFNISSKGTYSATLDSITLSNSLEEWGKDRYKCFAIYITTDDGKDITSKEEYKDCYVSIDGMGEYPDNSAPAKIRGRGNSTWEWYPKKPYRIKFNTTTKVLGIEKNKDWVLLANYRDMTDMMNVYASITAKYMGIPFTTPVRFAEVFLNGNYMGIYQIAEQVEVGGHRVDIDEKEGLLLTLDVDDGPDLSPDADNNFFTAVFGMPMAVKNPKKLSAEQLQQVKDDFAVLENAIKAHNYDAVDELMDIPSYIAMIQLQEYLYNVELSAPRSVFLFRDKDGKYTFGPAWDWDAGYDFDWSDMYTGHTFFTDYRETILGTDPYKRNGTYRCSHFFTDMFGSGKFVKQYKEAWAAIADNLYTANWEETQKYVDGLYVLQRNGEYAYTTPMKRDRDRWPINKFIPNEETEKMKTWLQNRLAYLNGIIPNYPEPDDEGGGTIPSEYTLVGTISKSYELSKSGGYSQSVKVTVAKDELATVLGVEANKLSASTLDLVPLNADGSVGTNTAAKNYGAWFDADGNTANYYTGDVHVYIESDDLFSLSCGCHPDNCAGNDQHTVTLQYRHYPTAKAVNLKVTFTIANDGWNWPWW